MGNEIAGYFLSFTTDEGKIIEQELVSRGYASNPVGLKEYILDSFDNKEVDDTLAEQIATFVKKNPDVIALYAGLGGTAIKGLVEKISGAMKKARQTTGP